MRDVSGGRDNNFNLIRITAAMAVVVSHAWPMTRGHETTQPLERLVGIQLGTLAVFVFFAVSGFLVAKSYERQASAVRWVRARAVRIFPGLAVALFLTTFVLGPLVTTLSVGDYLAHPATWANVPRGLSLAFRQGWLPGVFEELPRPQEVNGSLWTLGHEVSCYAILLALAAAGALRRRWLTLALFAALNVAVAVAKPALMAHPTLLSLLHFLLPFGWGVTFHAFRDRVPLTPRLLVPAGALAVAAQATPLDLVVAVAVLAYGVLVLAFLPWRWLHRYNRLGDYSYGVYIYGWPVQQTMMHAFGPMEPWQNAALALPVALALGVLSWNLVEKPALDWLKQGARAR